MTEGSFRVDLHDVLANDEHVVALTHVNGQRAGKTLDGNEAHVFNMKDGRVTEFWGLAEDRYAEDDFLSANSVAMRRRSSAGRSSRCVTLA
jgi:uncharacterized protein